MWEYQSNRINDSELYHTGVMGMKWGRRRSVSKTNANYRLAIKAVNKDKKATTLNGKSEKQHSKIDLEGANKMAKKSARYSVRSSKLEKRAIKTDNDFKRTMLERRSTSLNYKATKTKMKANKISKTKGYGIKAMAYSIKSDKVAISAANARRKIANNNAYIANTNRKMSSLSNEKLAKVEADWFAPMKSAISRK